MDKISVVISAYNEEKKIEDCLKSVKWADEIIFIDNSSTDKTVEIAKKYTNNIFRQKNNPLSVDLLKNLGFEKVKNEWILSIDADETVSKDLEEEIKNIVKAADKTAYYIPRKNIIFGKWMKHTGWYPDYQLRLFRKGKGKFTKKHVHESITVEGEIGYLSNFLNHENYSTIQEFIKRTVFVYAPNEAENFLEKGYTLSIFDAIRFPTKEFLSRFFAREGYKDGFHGLMLSIFLAFYHFIIFALIWEKRGFEKFEDKNILKEVEQEFKENKRQVKYWFLNENIKSSQSFLQKNLLKIKRKLT